jgi:hypothetical protein
MEATTAQIIIALVTLVGVLGTACVGLWGTFIKARYKLTQATAEMEFQSAALSFEDFLEDWDSIEKDIDTLQNNSPIDRFLILRAWNGMLEPRWTTAIYQRRQGLQEPIGYTHFELDTDYQQKLQEISIRSNMVLTIEQMPEGKIKDIFLAEGVKHAVMFLIDRKEMKGSKTKAITYCTFATHEDTPIAHDHLVRCAQIVGRLKGASLAFQTRAAT